MQSYPPDYLGKKNQENIASLTLEKNKFGGYFYSTSLGHKTAGTNSLKVQKQPSPGKQVKMAEQLKARSDQLQHHTSLYYK